MYVILLMQTLMFRFRMTHRVWQVFFNQIQNGGLSKIRYVPSAIICMCSRIFKSGISRKETYSGKTIDIFLSFMYISFVLSIIFFVPSVTIQWKSRRFPKWSHNVYILEKWILCEDINKQWYWIEKFEKILLPISIFPKSIQSSG